MTDVSTGLHSIARVATPKARSYMIQLCKHFAHKVEASQTDILRIMLTAEDEAGLNAVEDIAARHLVRFAFKEDLAIHWVRQD